MLPLNKWRYHKVNQNLLATPAAAECSEVGPGKYLDRAEAAEYLTSRGLRISKTTLQKFATIGGGPAYQRFGHRCVYTTENLNTWANNKLTPVRVSSSQVAA
jgi:hypothetical protein